jgi:hypothetical protein
MIHDILPAGPCQMLHGERCSVAYAFVMGSYRQLYECSDIWRFGMELVSRHTESGGTITNDVFSSPVKKPKPR